MASTPKRKELSTIGGIEVVNVAENDTEDLIADLTSVVYSFTARLYGQRRAKRTTQRLPAELEAKEDDDAPG